MLHISKGAQDLCRHYFVTSNSAERKAGFYFSFTGKHQCPREKGSSNKTPTSRKVCIWVVGMSINSLYEILKKEQSFR